MTFFPGGTVTNRSTQGYSFAQNFFSTDYTIRRPVPPATAFLQQDAPAARRAKLSYSLKFQAHRSRVFVTSCTRPGISSSQWV
jgi:hypothetical protein